MTRRADNRADRPGAPGAPDPVDPLDHARQFPLLGIPLRVRSREPRAIALAAEAFAVWDALDPALVERGTAVEMQVSVHDAEPGDDHAFAAGARPFVYRRDGPVLVGACGSARLTIDLAARRYVARVPSAALDHPEWYAWHVNGMARFAVSALDRQPFHAATWIVDSTAVMVTGPAGAGKSTLAYAALRQRLPLLAEEATHVALAGGLRLWGHADRIALAGRAVELFPELVAWPAALRPSGKVKRAFPTAQHQPVPPLTHRGPVVLCVLTGQHSGAPRLERLSPAARAAVLTAAPEAGFDQFPDGQRRLVAAFAGTPAYRLSAGADPDAAVDALARAARQDRD